MTYYLGVMLGSSADSIDVAIIDITTNKTKFVFGCDFALEISLRQQLLALEPNLQISIAKLYELEQAISVNCLAAIQFALEQIKLQVSALAAIGVHGYTCLHQPNSKAFTSIQLVNANYIAQRLQLPVVTDFRRADILLGGQGAPLAPAFHYHLWQNHKDIAIVNIGGMANITTWQADSCLGFDTGPGNVWLDAWCNLQQHKPYDAQGVWASQGTVNQSLLTALKSIEYFDYEPPKSTSRDDFNLAKLQAVLSKLPVSINPVDVQATLVELTAWSIVVAVQRFSPWVKTIYLCGGGSYNDFLISRLEALSNIKFENITVLGWDPRWLEAAAFAWLAKQRMVENKINIASVTGASSNTLLGAVYSGVV